MRLVEYVLSMLFPMRRNLRLTQSELGVSLDYHRRDRRTRPYYIWSAAGNLKQYPARPKPTLQERRNRDLSKDDVVLSVGGHVFITRLR
jgi:hypothetical protein